MMKMSPKGLALLKQFEGVKLTAYRDVAGVWTIGYGHTAAAGGIAPKAGVTITQAQADAMLVNDLGQYERAVFRALTKTPNQNQFDAMVSLCYNIGTGGFSKSSVVRHFNAGENAKAANAFLAWNKAGGKVVRGLTVRRSAEMDLFMAEIKPLAAVEPVPAPTTPRKPENVSVVNKTDFEVKPWWKKWF